MEGRCGIGVNKVRILTENKVCNLAKELAITNVDLKFKALHQLYWRKYSSILNHHNLKEILAHLNTQKKNLLQLSSD